jgi:hypothetical protein
MARASKERLDCELLSTAEADLGLQRCPKVKSEGESVKRVSNSIPFPLHSLLFTETGGFK